MNFKTQQEIWKYLADGGTIKSSSYGTVKGIKFEKGKLNSPGYTFNNPIDWVPDIEPLKAESNCDWIEYNGVVFPITYHTSPIDFKSFIGKKTKITIEEIL